MSILNEAQTLALQFIQTANYGGYSPSASEVQEWVHRPDLKRGKVTKRKLARPTDLGVGLHSQALEKIGRDLSKSILPLSMQIQQTLATMSSLALVANTLNDRWIEEREPDETLVEQLLRFRWVSSSSTGSGLLLTELGRALLRGEAESTASSDVTVLGGGDPLAWGGLVGTIADAGACLVVDPYLQLDHLLTIAQHTSTARVLMRRPDKDSKLVPWKVCLASPDLDIDVRVIDPKILHDRYIVGETKVYTLGCSLNGVGRKPTTLVPLSGDVADKIRAITEGWWAAGEPVGDPSAPEPGQDQRGGSKDSPENQDGEGSE